MVTENPYAEHPGDDCAAIFDEGVAAGVRQVLGMLREPDRDLQQRILDDAGVWADEVRDVLRLAADVLAARLDSKEK